MSGNETQQNTPATVGSPRQATTQTQLPTMAPNVGGLPFVIRERIAPPRLLFGGTNLETFIDQYEAFREQKSWDETTMITKLPKYVDSELAPAMELLAEENTTWDQLVVALNDTFDRSHTAAPQSLSYAAYTELMRKKFSRENVKIEILALRQHLKVIGNPGELFVCRSIIECTPSPLKEQLTKKYHEKEPILKDLMAEVREGMHTLPEPASVSRPTVPARPPVISQMDASVLSQTSSLGGASFATTQSTRPRRCLYCDDTSHEKRECTLLTQDKNDGLVWIADNGYVFYADQSANAPPRIGRGGMRASIIEYEKAKKEGPSTAATRRVVLDDIPEVPLSMTVQVGDFDAQEILSPLSQEWKVVASEGDDLQGFFEDPVNAYAAKRRRATEEVDDHNEGVEIRKNTPEVTLVDASTNTEKRVPKFTHQSAFDEVRDDDALLDKILDSEVAIPLRTLIGSVPSLQRGVKDLSKKTRRPLQAGEEMDVQLTSVKRGEADRATGAVSLTSRTTYTHGVINGKKTSLCIDLGSEVNLISKHMCDKLELPIKQSSQVPINGVGGEQKSIGVCVAVPVLIGKVLVKAHFFVVEALKGGPLLGMPFCRDADVTIEKDLTGKKWVILSDGEHLVRFPMVNESKTVGAAEVRRISLGNLRKELEEGDEVVAQIMMSGIGAKEETYDSLAAKYKPAGVKIHPVAVPLPPELQLESTQVRSNPKRRLTEERLAGLRIGDGELSEIEIEYFRERLKEQDKAFAFEDSEIGVLSEKVEPPVRIPMVHHTPWNHAPYPMPRALHSRVIEMLKKKLESGIIEPSIGPYANRWFVVQKKDGKSLRFIQDVQEVNKYTIRNAGAPPNADEMAEDVSGRAILTVFDLYSGYDQLSVHPEDRDIFSLQTPIGLVRMTRLPQGWTNSVGVYQRIITKVMMRHIPEPVSVFMDDGVIKGSRTKDESINARGIRKFVSDHVEDVVSVLSTLNDAGLTVNGYKCHFGVRSATVLGYLCSDKGREPTTEYKDKILRWPRPRDITEVRAFLATCGYYRVWVPHFSVMADPLHELTRKGVEFRWKREQEMAFRSLKKALTSALVIRPPVYGDPKRPLILTTDASPIGAGAVLGQCDEEGNRYVIRFESQLFNETQRRYSQVKRELYTIFRMIEKLKKYLHGVHFVLETDAKPVIGMLKQPNLPNDAASRWIAYITTFSYSIVHISGKSNVVADALSRFQCQAEDEDEGSDTDDIRHGLEVKRVAPGNGVVVSIGPDEGEYLGVESTKQVAAHSIRQDSEYFNIATFLDCGANLETNAKKKEALVKAARSYLLSDGLLFFKAKDGPPRRVIEDETSQVQVMKDVHSGHPSAHRGMKGTLRLCADRFFWKGMGRTAERVVRECEACQREGKAEKPEPLKPYLGSTLFSRVGVDLVEMPKADTGECYIAVARDDFSGWVEAKALPSKESLPVYRFLYDEVITRFGIPGEVVADRGELHSERIQALAADDGLTLKFTSPYYPQTNGMVERGHRPLVECLRKLSAGNEGKWPTFLASALWADRISWKRTTGETPFRLVMGYECVLPMDTKHFSWSGLDWGRVKTASDLLAIRAVQLQSSSWLREVSGLSLDKSRRENKEWFDKAHRVRGEPLKAGDLVLMKSIKLGKKASKLEQRWKGPYRIRAEFHEGAYQLEELDGTFFRRSVNGRHLLPFYQSGGSDGALAPAETRAGGVVWGREPSHPKRWSRDENRYSLHRWWNGTASFFLLHHPQVGGHP